MENIVEKLDEMTARKIKTSPHNSNRASECGHPCIRFLVLSRTSQGLKSLHDVGLQRIFDEGHLHEAAVLQELRDAGYTLVEQQRHLEWREFQLTGSIDAKIAINGDRIPLEIKSCSPNIFPGIKDMAPEEMLHSKHQWIRKYPAQLLIYMLLCEEKIGLMLFKNKGTGEKCQKVFELTDSNLEYAESILKKLESVNAHIKAGTEPPAAFIDDCKSCGFCKTACFPGRDYGPGIDMLEDPELEVKLSRRAELEAAAKEFEALDKEIKEGFRGRTAVIGDWMIESKEHERKSPDIPADIKKQYEKISKYWITKIERLT